MPTPTRAELQAQMRQIVKRMLAAAPSDEAIAKLPPAKAAKVRKVLADVRKMVRDKK